MESPPSSLNSSPAAKSTKPRVSRDLPEDWLDEDEPEEVECWLFDEELSLE
ncbi:MAG: hypothetical protein ACOX5R_11725 [bacterium]